MKLTEARVTIINDDEKWNQSFADRLKFRQFPYWYFATTLESGLSVIQQIGSSNPNGVNILLLDENLRSGKERNDGQVLYEEVLKYNLLSILSVASISNAPQLPIVHVAADGHSIEAFIGSVVLR
jgi:hypothetical protein